jgi:hypothetical protein
MEFENYILAPIYSTCAMFTIFSGFRQYKSIKTQKKLLFLSAISFFITGATHEYYTILSSIYPFGGYDIIARLLESYIYPHILLIFIFTVRNWDSFIPGGIRALENIQRSMTRYSEFRFIWLLTIAPVVCYSVTFIQNILLEYIIPHMRHKIHNLYNYVDTVCYLFTSIITTIFVLKNDRVPYILILRLFFSISLSLLAVVIFVHEYMPNEMISEILSHVFLILFSFWYTIHGINYDVWNLIRHTSRSLYSKI